MTNIFITNWYLIAVLGYLVLVASQDLQWLLYSIDHHHCLLYDNRLFCHQPYIHKNKRCTYGKLLQFSALKTLGISPDTLLDWLIPFQNIEYYSSYLNSSVTFENADDTYICNCTHNHIGSNCEYELLEDLTTLKATLDFQLSHPDKRANEVIACITDDTECISVFHCLEWRQICDGIINCHNGADEINCHYLEFHVCDTDEFQCRNGMCIPIEFLFDAAIDCMDASDEQEIFSPLSVLYKCPTKSTFECDEHFCNKDEFSCGDGQCIHWSNLLNQKENCKNYRDIAYRCEIVQRVKTMPNGICVYNGQYKQIQNSSSCFQNLNQLLAGVNRANSFNHIVRYCPELIHHPEQPILSPVLNTFYKKSRIIDFYRNHSFRDQLPRTTPDIVCLNGSLLCDNLQTVLLQEHCVDYDKFQQLSSEPFFPINHWFCQVARDQQRNKTINTSDTIRRDDGNIKMWASNSFFCNGSLTNLISIRRVNDGHYDCIFGDDEKNDRYEIMLPHRYRCETSIPYQVVSFSQLGNTIKECRDGSDEISYELDWSFFRCEYEDDYACWVLRGGIHENRIKEVQLLFHRYCDSVWDTMGGRDERNCSEWICASGMHQCNRSRQCISPANLCDGEFDCSDGEDELNCPKLIPYWTIENQCDKSAEHFCITFDYLTNPRIHRPCIHYTRAGDGRIDCIGGREERNVFACSDYQMLGDRFICDNTTKCIEHTAVCNGIYDCKDRTDELICFWNHQHCDTGQYSCLDGRKCITQRCNSSMSCSQNEHWFWCPNINSTNVYRPNKIRRPSNYESFCRNYHQNLSKKQLPLISYSSTAKLAYNINKHGYCNRGFYLASNNGTTMLCFCPPSFYGNRCQYNRRRITVRVRLHRRHRFDIAPMVHVLVTLVYNGTTMVDHRTFTDTDQDFPLKHDIYLWYPRPKPQGMYSIRFEAYDVQKFLCVWEYSISPLDFLPAFRLAKILRFPDRSIPWLCNYNHCKNLGICYVSNNNQSSYICLCSNGWHGIHCELKLERTKCASDAIARNENICVCPYGYLQPHCFVRNDICNRSNPCERNEICAPFSNLPPRQYSCLCNSLNCGNKSKATLVLNRKKSNDQALLLQLLKFSSGYPRVRQQILIPPSTEFPANKLINIRDLRHPQGVIPEIGLMYTFHPETYFVRITRSIFYINCSNQVRNFTVDLDTQPKKCHQLSEDVHQSSTSVFHSLCSNPKFRPCFYSESYMCYCDLVANRSECISYRQRDISCMHCINQGYCVQGDLQNRSDFKCVCPKCITGSLCQFASNRFSISLEILIEKSRWSRFHFIGPSVLLFLGLIFNGLCIATFRKAKARHSGTGMYLLINAIVSQLLISVMFIRICYLILTREIIIHHSLNSFLCKSLPFLMFSLHYLSLWLTAFVTIDRTCSVIFIIKFRPSQPMKSSLILTIVTAIIIFGSLYEYITQYKLINHPEESMPWCIREIVPRKGMLVQYVSLIHQIAPFIINLLAGLTIIYYISHSKAVCHHEAMKYVFMKQIRERIDLLLGPIICFITQLPQIVTLFIDACSYEGRTWFVNVTVITYYISYLPQISLFFSYVVPSPTYRKILMTETVFVKLF